jgi:hypothetical protein
LAYSFVNYLICFALVSYVIDTPKDQWVTWRITLVCIVTCLISPAILAFSWYKLRSTFLHRRFGMDHPTQRGWDFYIRRNSEFWVLFHLKNGKMVGGYFGERSYASTYPQEPELYVEEVWRVDYAGKFVEMVTDTNGAVIRQAEWERVEFFNVKREVTNEYQEGGERGAGYWFNGTSSPGRDKGAVRSTAVISGATDSASGRLGNGTHTISTPTQEVRA